MKISEKLQAEVDAAYHRIQKDPFSDLPLIQYAIFRAAQYIVEAIEGAPRVRGEAFEEPPSKQCGWERKYTSNDPDRTVVRVCTLALGHEGDCDI